MIIIPKVGVTTIYYSNPGLGMNHSHTTNMKCKINKRENVFRDMVLIIYSYTMYTNTSHACLLTEETRIEFITLNLSSLLTY